MADFLNGAVFDVPRSESEIVFSLRPNADTQLGAADFFWCPDDASVATRYAAVTPGEAWHLPTELVNGLINQFSMSVRAAPTVPTGRQVTFELTVRTGSGQVLVQQMYVGQVAPDKLVYALTDLVRFRRV